MTYKYIYNIYNMTMTNKKPAFFRKFFNGSVVPQTSYTLTSSLADSINHLFYLLGNYYLQDRKQD